MYDAKMMTNLLKIEQDNTDGMMVILSDVFLDEPQVRIFFFFQGINFLNN
jgi:hypothetical protein